MPTQNYFTIFFGAATILSLLFAVAQNRSATRVKKILDDYTKGLLEDVKRISGLVKGEGKLKTEMNRLREKLITLDIVNRNLTKERIDEMEKSGELKKQDAETYRKLTSK